MSRDFKVQVPVVTHQQVTITNDHLIQMLEQLLKDLCKGYDRIIVSGGKYVYYRYAPLDMDEEYGDKVDPATLELYLAYVKVINHLKGN